MSSADIAVAPRTRGRLWFYTNYHCNLACRYCLTESRPDAPQRMLDRALIEAIADDAVTLGFDSFGVTGGEPFLRADIAEILISLGRRLPTVVLTNGTLFSKHMLTAIAPLADLPVDLQISLDSADAAVNDAARGTGDFARVVAAIPALLARGHRVRIGTTVADGTPLETLCELHRSLGISDDDHVVRPIIGRGRAGTNALGIEATFDDLPAELTITTEGSFWSPAAPTVQNDRLDIDYLLTRTIRPLTIPLAAMDRVAGAQPMREGAFRIT